MIYGGMLRRSETAIRRDVQKGVSVIPRADI